MLDLSHDPGSKRRRLWAILAAAAVPGAFDAIRELARGNPIEPWDFAFTTAGTLALLAALTIAFDFCIRLRFTSTGVFMATTALAILVGVGEAFLASAISDQFGISIVAKVHRAAPILLRIGAIDGVLVLGLWAMAVFLPFAMRDAYAHAIEAERLRAAAELARMRANLQPHFLFNTLSTIAGLIGENPSEARKLIGVLGDLLRDSLDSEMDEMQTLEGEVNWLKRYAGILETRHRGYLTFRWEIAEETRKMSVPCLLLQPLLENAVTHGALRRAEGGEVVVRTTIDPGRGGRLTCIIEDNGPGPSRTTRPGARGIEIVTRRLGLKYAGAAAFRLECADGHTRSIVEIPAETAS